MSIRRTFLLLVVPLFLLLASVNGALLYFWERAEAERGLDQQAIAAAVTVAAFAEARGDIAEVFVRTAPFRAAGGDLAGLEIVAADHTVTRLIGNGSGIWFSHPWNIRAPEALDIGPNPSGRRVASAVAPMTGGGYVLAQIDAEPLFDQVAELQRLIAGLVAAAGLIGLVLALIIARGIVRELAANSALIEALRTDAPGGEADGLRLRETRDLALAVRLMRTSVSGRLARGRHELARRDRERDEAASVAAYRETAFPPLSTDAAGTGVAARMLGAAPAGSFYALCVASDRAALVLGECPGETPAAALARALSARSFFAAHVLDGDPEDRLAEGRKAFEIGRVEWLAWSETDPPGARALALLDGDDAGRAAAYVRHGVGLSPGEMLDDLTTLLQGRGALAVVGPASAEGGDG